MTNKIILKNFNNSFNNFNLVTSSLVKNNIFINICRILIIFFISKVLNNKIIVNDNIKDNILLRLFIISFIIYIAFFDKITTILLIVALFVILNKNNNNLINNRFFKNNLLNNILLKNKEHFNEPKQYSNLYQDLCEKLKIDDYNLIEQSSDYLNIRNHYYDNLKSIYNLQNNKETIDHSKFILKLFENTFEIINSNINYILKFNNEYISNYFLYGTEHKERFITFIDTIFVNDINNFENLKNIKENIIFLNVIVNHVFMIFNLPLKTDKKNLFENEFPKIIYHRLISKKNNTKNKSKINSEFSKEKVNKKHSCDCVKHHKFRKDWCVDFKDGYARERHECTVHFNKEGCNKMIGTVPWIKKGTCRWVKNENEAVNQIDWLKYTFDELFILFKDKYKNDFLNFITYKFRDILNDNYSKFTNLYKLKYFEKKKKQIKQIIMKTYMLFLMNILKHIIFYIYLIITLQK